jgi:hypothetical protein
MAKKKQISNKPKRKINSGLKAWNDARSFFSKQNKAAGKKYNGVELNALTKSFLFEHWIINGKKVLAEAKQLKLD